MPVTQEGWGEGGYNQSIEERRKEPSSLLPFNAYLLLQYGSSQQSAVLQEVLASAQVLHGPQLLPWISKSSVVGFFMGCRVYICSVMVLSVDLRKYLFQHSLFHKLQGNTCSGSWSSSSHRRKPCRPQIPNLAMSTLCTYMSWEENFRTWIKSKILGSYCHHE